MIFYIYAVGTLRRIYPVKYIDYIILWTQIGKERKEGNAALQNFQANFLFFEKIEAF